jgi:Lrp/AsnC family transcriptional regulator, leucine-responsive regulatory protein
LAQLYCALLSLEQDYCVTLVAMSQRHDLDNTDRELLRLLQEDGRRSAADMAGLLSLSGTAVSRRIARLEQSGVIRGYSARIDPAALDLTIEAFVEVRFVGNMQPAEVHRSVTTIPEVSAVFTTSGAYDALVWVRVRSVEHLTAVIGALRRGPRIVDTRTHIVLGSHVERLWDADTRPHA